ncbi:hypothetical protein F2P79_015317 [Pimephales promelas]|nr:hypothetical protein F2P79_015317 [Pimephales promelas]
MDATGASCHAGIWPKRKVKHHCWILTLDLEKHGPRTHVILLKSSDAICRTLHHFSHRIYLTIGDPVPLACNT